MDTLPGETHSHALAYLTASELCAAATTCRAWRKVASASLVPAARPQWRALWERDFAPWRKFDGGGGSGGKNNPETMYQRSVAAHRERLRVAGRAVDTRAVDDHLLDKQALAACVFDLVHVRILVPLIGLSLLLLACLIPLSMDGVVEWPVWLVCMPIWILVSVVFLAAAITVVAERHTDDSQSIWHRLVRRDGGQEPSFVVWAVLALGKS